ncbi:MAG: RNA polymerase sigma factor [Chitinophagaceae bacterium]
METLQLVKACIKNDRQAQQHLYNKYAGNMLGLCYRYTKSLHDAEDVLQEGFIKVFNNIEQFKNDGDLGAWIRRIMVNTALTYLKKHNRYKSEMVMTEANLHPITDENAEINVNTKDLVEQIRKLPTNQQTIFNLVAVEGYSQVEIAEMLQTNINTIRSNYSRGRATLIKMIEQENNRTNKYAK